MYRVMKRDGSTVDFDVSKISAAMVKAFEAVGREYHISII
jgi:ribonucleoside-triphosphate reductase